MVKRILTITTWILTALGLVFLLGFARMTHYSAPVTSLQLEITHQPGGGFLPYNQTFAEISEIVGANRTKALGWTNVRSLVAQLNLNPYVASAEASTTIERGFRVKLIERKPVVRFYTTSDQSFYIDDQKVIFPTHPDFIARVIIANGQIGPLAIPQNKAMPLSSLINKTHAAFAIQATADAINRDELMQVLIDQIYIAEDSTIELTPKIGDAPILLGDTTAIRLKISNISAFYKTQSNNPALHTYQTINASFRNQIVCTKRDSL